MELCGFVLKSLLILYHIQHVTSQDVSTQTPDEPLRPGFKVRVTQSGLEYASDVAVGVLSKEMLKVQIPSVREKVALMQVTISDIRMVSFPPPESRLFPATNGRLIWNARSIRPELHANYHARLKQWFVTINKRGSIRVRGDDMSMQLEFELGVDADGKPTIFVDECDVMGNVDFDFSGGWSDLLEVGANVLKRRIRSLIHAQICLHATQEVNEQAAGALAGFSVQQSLAGFRLDFRLLSAPNVSQYGIDTSHDGSIYSALNHTRPPFEPPAFPPFEGRSEKMVYLYVSDYMFNSGLHTAWRNGLLNFTLAGDSTPAELREYLAMTCPGTLCLGGLYPDLADEYPDMVAELQLTADRSPVVRFVNGRVLLEGSMLAHVYSAPVAGRQHLFTADLGVEAEVAVSVINRTLYFTVSDIEPSGSVKMTSVISIGLNFFMKTALALGTDRFLVPFLEDLGAKGIVLPDIDFLSFTNPHINLPVDYPGVMIIGTDVRYDGP